MKRFIDLIFSSLALLFLFMPIVCVALLIKLSSSGEVLFWSKRFGKNGVIFTMPKFRTMYINAPIVAKDLLSNPSKHITKLGRILRISSIDEFPQLYSVMVGEMSLVGPRPALYSQIELNEIRDKLGINRLRPGITGWAQVNGRDSLSVEDKVMFDKEYLLRRSILFDFQIILKTLLVVIYKKNLAH